jgi:hypothetical protein
VEGIAGCDHAEPSLLFGIGVVIYDSAVTVHYLTLELEASRVAEEAALRYRVLAREAELKAFGAGRSAFSVQQPQRASRRCADRGRTMRQMARSWPISSG